MAGSFLALGTVGILASRAATPASLPDNVISAVPYQSIPYFDQNYLVAAARERQYC